jgi:hypothetical protein
MYLIAFYGIIVYSKKSLNIKLINANNEVNLITKKE